MSPQVRKLPQIETDVAVSQMSDGGREEEEVIRLGRQPEGTVPLFASVPQSLTNMQDAHRRRSLAADAVKRQHEIVIEHVEAETDAGKIVYIGTRLSGTLSLGHARLGPFDR